MSKFSAIIEGAVTYLKMRDRKLTEKFLSLAVKDTFVPVLHGYFYQVTVPWMVGLTVVIGVVCLCARGDSPCCNICSAHNK